MSGIKFIKMKKMINKFICVAILFLHSCASLNTIDITNSSSKNIIIMAEINKYFSADDLNEDFEFLNISNGDNVYFEIKRGSTIQISNVINEKLQEQLPFAYFGSNSATYFGVLVPVISV